MDISDAIDRLEAFGFESSGGYSESAIVEFESTRSVKLPPEYRQFLREYGDAGNPKCDGRGAAFSMQQLSPFGRTLWIDRFSPSDQSETPPGYFTIGPAFNWELGDSGSPYRQRGRARVVLKCSPPDFGAVYLLDPGFSTGYSDAELLVGELGCYLPEIEEFVAARRLGRLPIDPQSEQVFYRLPGSFLDFMRSTNDTWPSDLRSGSGALWYRMNESEWLACDSLERMCKHLSDRSWYYVFFDDRRHFLAACLRRIGHLITDERFHRAVDVVERLFLEDSDVAKTEWRAVEEEVRRAASRFIFENVAQKEGEVGDEELRRAIDLDACRQAAAAMGANSGWAEPNQARRVAGAGLSAAAAAMSREKDDLFRVAADSEYVASLLNQPFTSSQQADLFREVIGNPFRHRFSRHALEKVSRTERVTNLIHSMYSERRFERMSELADALAEAGCRDVEILDHCRSNATHVRGCWVLELLLNAGFRGRDTSSP